MSISPVGGRQPLDAAESLAAESAPQAAALTPHIATGADPLGHFVATKAVMYRDGGTIKLEGPFGVEVGAKIRYDGALNSPTRGRFFMSTQIGQPIGGRVPPPSPEKPMTKAEMVSLKGALDRELQHPPAGVDPSVLKNASDALFHAIRAVEAKSSTKFDYISWNDIRSDGHGGAIAKANILDENIEVKVDKKGRVFARSDISMNFPNTWTELQKADKVSLAKSLDKWLPTVRLDQPHYKLWQKMLAAAKK